MAEVLMMIALSPTMEKGTIQRWNVQEGDKFASGDVLCEVETDKTTMEYEAPDEGTLLKIIVPEGGQAAIAQPIAIYGEEGEDISALLKETPAKPAEVATVQETGTATEATVTPAAVPESPADVLFEKRIRISPLARKIARQKGIDPAGIQGSGPGGRIVKSDLEKAAAPVQSKQRISPATTAAVEDDIILPVSDKRRIIAQRLAESKYTAPHYYLKLGVEMDDVLAARKKYNTQHPDGKLSLNAFLIKFAAEALKRHPIVNATWTGDTIRQHPSIDIGLAVAQEDGLITPVVRDCGSKGLQQIDAELSGLIRKAQDGKLAPEEYSGATFTISNLGSYGIEEFTAIINPPGSAILAVGAIQKTPVVDEADQIVVKSIMKLTLSCDHRIIDGAKGAAFLKDLKDIIEDPLLALM